MSEPAEPTTAERAVAVIARATGNTVAPAVSAVLTVASVATKNPDLAVASVPAGALAGSLAEEAVHGLRRIWTEDRARIFVEAAADVLGIAADDVARQAFEDRKVTQLLGEAAAAAVDAHDEAKIRLLARAYVRGASDPAKVDEMRLIIGVVDDMEVPEIRMLAVLAETNPQTLTRPIGNRKVYFWSNEDIERSDPGLRGVVDLVGRKLEKAGLVDEHSNSYVLSRFGASVTDILGRLGSIQ